MVSRGSTLPSSFQHKLDDAVAALQSRLGDNLCSLVLYGSAVRGGVHIATSDLNLLVVLHESTASAHDAIREICTRWIRLDPMVIEKRAMPRAMRVFALKFKSIQRNSRVLAGADPFAELDVPVDLLVMLSEQELRNLRMRLIRAFVLCGRNPRLYLGFVRRNTTRLFIALSDALRCRDVDLPKELASRVPVFASALGVDASVLLEIQSQRSELDALSAEQAFGLHARLDALLESAIHWIEREWPTPPI